MLNNLRIGFGFDTHKLEANKKLFIGGVLIESHFGAVGHSDADVLLHAICDALLGAANLGDIGVLFPNNNNKWKNIRSTKLLDLTYKTIIQNGFSIINIDSTVCLETPKINSKRTQMQKTISEILNVPENKVSVKATTNEQLGFVGRSEGISAYAIALLYTIS